MMAEIHYKSIPKVTSTDPKVKLITQPMDVIQSALFEGDMNRLLPKITSFLVQLFGFFFYFLDFFKYFLKSLKKNKSALQLQIQQETSFKGQTHQFQVAEHTYAKCKDTCVGYRHSGENPLPVKRESSCEGYKKWLCMARHETSSGYMADNKSQGIWHKAQ